MRRAGWKRRTGCWGNWTPTTAVWGRLGLLVQRWGERGSPAAAPTCSLPGLSQSLSRHTRRRQRYGAALAQEMQRVVHLSKGCGLILSSFRRIPSVPEQETKPQLATDGCASECVCVWCTGTSATILWKYAWMRCALSGWSTLSINYIIRVQYKIKISYLLCLTESVSSGNAGGTASSSPSGRDVQGAVYHSGDRTGPNQRGSGCGQGHI